jgi:hypothetical protein
MVVERRTATAVLVVARRICGPWLVPGMTPRVVHRVCWLRVAVAVPGITAWVVRVVG